MTNVLIVAPALNEAAALPEFIQGFFAWRSTLESSVATRLLVVDDGSTDRTLEVLRSRPTPRRT